MRVGGNQPVSDERLLEIVAVCQSVGTAKEAEERLGISQSTIRQHRKTAALRGLTGFAPVMEGFEIARVTNTPKGDYVQQRPERTDTYQTPAGHQIRGVSSLVGGDGRTIQQWIKTTPGVDPTAVVELLRASFAEYHPAAPISILDANLSYANNLTLYPISDMHVNMLSWKEETGNNWDLKIAQKEISGAFEKVVRRTEPSKFAVVLGGGDAIHADSNAGTTTKGTPQDTDGRYDKAVDVTCHLFVRMIELALQKHEKVLVRVLKGNHDEHASVAVTYFLLAWYRNEPRVEVCKSPSLFWNYRFGLVMLAAHHGHECKPADMPGKMAGYWAEDWGLSKFRYAHTFHEHHLTKRVIEGGGAIVETHQAPCPADAWSFGKGFVSGRTMCSIAYDPQLGECARVTVPL